MSSFESITLTLSVIGALPAFVSVFRWSQTRSKESTKKALRDMANSTDYLNKQKRSSWRYLCLATTLIATRIYVGDVVQLSPTILITAAHLMEFVASALAMFFGGMAIGTAILANPETLDKRRAQLEARLAKFPDGDKSTLK